MMQLYSGGLYEFGDYVGKEVTLVDLVHATSMICRFTGHVKEFYSVAQHQTLGTAYLLDSGFDVGTARAYHCHDLEEGLVGDIQTDLKRNLRWLSPTDYAEDAARFSDFAESTSWQVVRKLVPGLPKVLPELVTQIDLRMLVTEAEQLFRGGRNHAGWGKYAERGIYPIEGMKISGWSPERAEMEWWKMWERVKP